MKTFIRVIQFDFYLSIDISYKYSLKHYLRTSYQFHPLASSPKNLLPNNELPILIFRVKASLIPQRLLIQILLNFPLAHHPPQAFQVLLDECETLTHGVERHDIVPNIGVPGMR